MPCCASEAAMARPMPRPPPVTSACGACGVDGMRIPRRTVAGARRQYILNLKLLQIGRSAGLVLPDASQRVAARPGAGACHCDRGVRTKTISKAAGPTFARTTMERARPAVILQDAAPCAPP